MFLVCFRFLFCFDCSFIIVGDTYFVQWVGGFFWFVGSWVVGSVCLPGVCALGPWGCSSTSSCFLAGLVLSGFFSLIRPYRIGVQRRWLELSFFLFFLDCYCFLGALYGVQPLHPLVNLQLCYLSFLQRLLSVIL
jgi:hypothetical protein